MVLCSSVPNPHLPSQIFPLITDLINLQHYLVSCINFYFSYLQKTKNFCLKRLSKPQYFFSLFFFSINLAFSLTKLLALFVYITFQYLIYYLKKKPSNSNVSKNINKYLESIIVYRGIDLQKNSS